MGVSQRSGDVHPVGSVFFPAQIVPHKNIHRQDKVIQLEAEKFERLKQQVIVWRKIVVSVYFTEVVFKTEQVRPFK